MDKDARLGLDGAADVAAVLGTNGPLARVIPGFAPRCQQQEMAKAVAGALYDDAVLLVEAGTGTGKTMAYLAPALLSGKRVIISTGTRNLQDQLYHKDLPLLIEALGCHPNIAVLKGRGNYLCRHRLALTEAAGRWTSPERAAEFTQIRRWAEQTRNGDITEATQVAEDSSLWYQVTSTADNCLGQNCPQWHDCFLVKARRKAFEADVLVINHHLFFADLVLKGEGFGELLPGADAFIIDEAHQLPEIASQFLGLSLSSRQLTDLIKDVLLEQSRDAPDFVDLIKYVRQLEEVIIAFRSALGEESYRAPWQKVAECQPVGDATAALQVALQVLQEPLQAAAVRSKGLENCYRRCLDLLARFDVLTEPATEETVHWIETRSRGFTLNSTPLNVASHFRSRMQHYPGAWIFTSATLAVGERFDHFADRLGLDVFSTLKLASPFDFSSHALLYLPEKLPEPASSDYIKALVAAAIPVLQASQARAFLLFTSYRALREAAQYLAGRLPYPLLVQGSLPQRELLNRFQTLGNALLLGTASFWEGVDVRGSALSCVIIDKLPFAAPSDPVLQGRISSMRRRGEDPFMTHQVPQAVLTLKQGVGRLIRDVNDRGVLMLCDPRLLSKAYGQVFLDSLPPMRRTRELQQVQHFFAVTNQVA